MEIPIHWLLDDAPNFVYAPVANRLGPMRNPDEVYGTWTAEFEGLYRYGRAFVLTMHPQYIGRPGRLLMLEKLIEFIKSHRNVEFMRGIDRRQAVRAGGVRESGKNKTRVVDLKQGS